MLDAAPEADDNAEADSEDSVHAEADPDTDDNVDAEADTEVDFKAQSGLDPPWSLEMLMLILSVCPLLHLQPPAFQLQSECEHQGGASIAPPRPHHPARLPVAASPLLTPGSGPLPRRQPELLLQLL